LLDLGCGTGDITIPMSNRANRIDAVDPSPAMLAVAQSRPGSRHSALHWICGSADGFDYPRDYSLVVAGESLHWMQWNRVLPRIAAALRPGGCLAIAIKRELTELPWTSALPELLSRYSTNRDFQTYDLADEIVRRDLFLETGRRATRAIHFRQPIDDYIESFHSRNGFSRARMNSDRACEFDDAVRKLVLPSCPDGVVNSKVSATVVWGLPLAI